MTAVRNPAVDDVYKLSVPPDLNRHHPQWAPMRTVLMYLLADFDPEGSGLDADAAAEGFLELWRAGFVTVLEDAEGMPYWVMSRPPTAQRWRRR